MACQLPCCIWCFFWCGRHFFNSAHLNRWTADAFNENFFNTTVIFMEKLFEKENCFLNRMTRNCAFWNRLIQFTSLTLSFYYSVCRSNCGESYLRQQVAGMLFHAFFLQTHSGQAGQIHWHGSRRLRILAGLALSSWTRYISSVHWTQFQRWGKTLLIPLNVKHWVLPPMKFVLFRYHWCTLSVIARVTWSRVLFQHIRGIFLHNKQSNI